MENQCAKVMKNYTICIPQKIRRELNIQIKDILILTPKKGKVIVEKVPSSWHEIAGLGKKVYRAYGGGEKYLKQERENWNKK